MNKKVKSKCNTIIAKCKSTGIFIIDYNYIVNEIGKNKDLIKYSNSIPDALSYLIENGITVDGIPTKSSSLVKPEVKKFEKKPNNTETKHSEKISVEQKEEKPIEKGEEKQIGKSKGYIVIEDDTILLELYKKGNILVSNYLTEEEVLNDKLKLEVFGNIVFSKSSCYVVNIHTFAKFVDKHTKYKVDFKKYHSGRTDCVFLFDLNNSNFLDLDRYSDRYYDFVECKNAFGFDWLDGILWKFSV